MEAIAKHRDPDAFIALFSHFAPRLKGYMKSRGAPDDVAEELTQEAMFIVWHKAKTYNPALSAVSSWIFTIARNLRIDAIRRDRRQAIDAADPILAPIPAPAPDEALDALERPVRLQTALGALPPEQLVAVLLAFYLGQTHGDIAAAQELPLGTVKSRLRLAFLRMRTTLDGPPTATASRSLAAMGNAA